MDKIEVIVLDRIESYQSKQIGLEQEDQTKQSKADASKKSGEEHFSLWKCSEG